MESRDLIVLGAGPGGYVAAIRAAQLGRKVTIVEREALGGVCLNWGCIPSKALLRSAQLYQELKHASEFGFETGGVRVDFPRIITRSRDVAGKLSSGVTYLMKKNKIEVLMGCGTLEDGNALTVTDAGGKATCYSYKDIIIATGARPKEIPGVEVDGEVIHTSRTALDFRRLPQKILIIGAGAIGMEFAYFYQTLGAQVTVCEMMDQILPLEDKEVADALQKIMQRQSVTIKTRAAVSDIKRAGKTVTATIKTSASDGVPQEEKWSGDACLIAVGVQPNTEQIGLEKTGIELTPRKFIKVDEFLHTNKEHHFAVESAPARNSNPDRSDLSEA